MRTSLTLNAGSLRSLFTRIHEQAFADSIVGSCKGHQNVLSLGIEIPNAHSETRTPRRQVGPCGFELTGVFMPGKGHPHRPQSRIVRGSFFSQEGDELLLLCGQVFAQKFWATILAFGTVNAGSGIRLNEQDRFKEIRFAPTSARSYVGGPNLRRITRKICDKSDVGGAENDRARATQTSLTHVIKMTQEASDLSKGERRHWP